MFFRKWHLKCETIATKKKKKQKKQTKKQITKTKKKTTKTLPVISYHSVFLRCLYFVVKAELHISC